MNQAEATTLNNFGFLRCAVPDDVRLALSSEIDGITSGTIEPSGARLPVTGRPVDGIWLTRSLSVLEPFIHGVTGAYDRVFNYIQTLDWLTGHAPFDFSDVWFNFQYKHHYVPPHIHGGVLSYVIWARIPYDIEAELAEFPAMPPEENKAASFNFIYSDALGRLRTHAIRLTGDDEWTMVMFPSSLMHFVNPFRTSDEARVSISGNIRLKV